MVNLYPFEATVAKGAAFDDCIENIDIGGPAMIRAAAKNHADVAVVVDAGGLRARCSPSSTQHGGTTTLGAAPEARRQGLCAHRRLRRRDLQLVRGRRSATTRPTYRAFGGKLAEALRYGENPHQRRRSIARRTSASASRPRGRCRASSSPTTTSTTPTPPTNASPSSIRSARAACVIIKHANPCGVAEGATLVEAYRKALACDPTSAFGGIVALNRTLDADAARAITEIFTEVIIAPDASDEAIAIVGAKKNLRLLLAGGLPDPRASGPDGEDRRRRPAGAVARQRRGRRHAA